jgi:hypothetical protein
LKGLSAFKLVVNHQTLVPIINNYILDAVENLKIQRLKERLSPYIDVGDITIFVIPPFRQIFQAFYSALPNAVYVTSPTPSLFPLFPMYQVTSVSIYKSLIHRKTGKSEGVDRKGDEKHVWLGEFGP